MAAPFFILAADLMTASGITTALLRFSQSLAGHIRGGLGHVNVVTSMLFAGISGSALADAAGPGATDGRAQVAARRAGEVRQDLGRNGGVWEDGRHGL